MRAILVLFLVVLMGCSMLERAPPPAPLTPEDRRARLRTVPVALPPYSIQTVKRLTRLFADVVFTSESGQRLDLHRWEGPVTVSLIGDAAEGWRPEVERVFRQLAQLTRRPMTVLPPGDRSGAIQFTITNDPRYWPTWTNMPRRGPWSCGASWRSWDSVFTNIWIGINASQQLDRRMMLSCLYEETFQGMVSSVSSAPLPTRRWSTIR